MQNFPLQYIIRDTSWLCSSLVYLKNDMVPLVEFNVTSMCSHNPSDVLTHDSTVINEAIS